MLAQAPQRSAPAIWNQGAQSTTVWTGIEAEVLQYTRSHRQGTLSETRHLTIPPIFPHEQMLLEATREVAHLVWLDAAYNAPEDGMRLWAAQIDLNGEVLRGEVALSTDVTYHFDGLVLDPQTVELVWSEGLASEPDLYARQVDSFGRPRLPRQLASDADWPALVETDDGTLWLFWVAHDTTVMQARLTEAGLEDVRDLTTIPYLGDGDILHDFRAGIDQTHAYLFWNLSRADGTYESYFTSSPLVDADWSSPRKLAISATSGEVFSTGFRGGYAQQAASGNSAITWISPLRGQYESLVAAVQVDRTLGILYFQQGAVQAYQPVVDLGDPGLLGPPLLQTDRDRNLILTWAEPSGRGYAELKLTRTQ